MARAERLRIGVSSCLLGNPVRYDGQHKRFAFLTEVMAPFVIWEPVCPELEIGLGVPRESIRLERRGDELRLVAPRSGADHTARMRRHADRRVRELAALHLDGFVLKHGSPSCGMAGVRVYLGAGVVRHGGRGAFASRLIRRLALLPVEEEGRLRDPALRDNWIERVFAYRRLRRLLRGRRTVGGLAAFHRAHDLQLRAHDPSRARGLTRLVASVRGLPGASVQRDYALGFMRALASQATRRRQSSVLRHASRRYLQRMGEASLSELAQVIDAYALGRAPLRVPIMLLRHHARSLRVAELADQVYLDPHPAELLLRYHV